MCLFFGKSTTHNEQQKEQNTRNLDNPKFFHISLRFPKFPFGGPKCCRMASAETDGSQGPRTV